MHGFLIDVGKLSDFYKYQKKSFEISDIVNMSNVPKIINSYIINTSISNNQLTFFQR